MSSDGRSSKEVFAWARNPNVRTQMPCIRHVKICATAIAVVVVLYAIRRQVRQNSSGRLEKEGGSRMKVTQEVY